MAKFQVRYRDGAEVKSTVLDAPNDEAVITRVRGEVAALCARFPVYR